MGEVAGLLTRHLDTFLLVLARLGGMLAFAPVLGHRAIPVPHRIGLGVLLALVLTPLLGPRPGGGPASEIALVLALAGEIFLGLVIGFVASLVVTTIQTAAELISAQMGLGIASVYDPGMGGQFNVLTRFYDLLALLLFLALDGHHLLVQAVVASFQRVAPGGLTLQPTMAAGVASLGGKVLRSGLELAAPVVGIVFVVNVAMALLARVAPQMNVFLLGVQLTIALGLFAAAETMPYFLQSATRMIAEIPGTLGVLLPGAPHGLR